jgi:hypothetical protein
MIEVGKTIISNIAEKSLLLFYFLKYIIFLALNHIRGE